MATTANVDVSAPKPKVNGELMETFSGKSVQLVLEKTSEHPLKGKASDGMEVSVDTVLDQRINQSIRIYQ